AAPDPSRAAPDPSVLEELLLLVAQHRVDLTHDFVGETLELLLDAVELVLRQVAVLLLLLELVPDVPAYVADRDPALLGSSLHHLHQRLAAVGPQLRAGQPDHRAVVRRVDAEVGLLDRLLDRLHRALVVGGDHEDAGLGHGETCELLQRHVGAVVVDLQLLDERRSCSAGANARELLLQVHDRLVHPIVGFVDLRMAHASSLELTIVPIGSPTSARAMLSGSDTSKTMIGSWLSMQNVIAVESITCSPRDSTSKWLRRS